MTNTIFENAFLELQADQRVIDYEEKIGNLKAIEWQFPGSTRLRQKVFFSDLHGGMPVRSECRVTVDGKELLYQVNETEWTQKGDRFLPIRMRLRDVDLGTKTAGINFTWYVGDDIPGEWIENAKEYRTKVIEKWILEKSMKKVGENSSVIR